MKLYKLGRVGDDGTNAFHDEATGFVVRAKSAKDARKTASKQPGDEGAAFWLDVEKSYCALIGQTDQGLSSRIILRAFDAG